MCRTTHPFSCLLLAALLAACGSSQTEPKKTAVKAPALPADKAITAFSLAGVAGIIDEATKTISVALPAGTNVTALVATFTITGTGVTVLGTNQVSGSSANDFSLPVVYVVTAEDGSTAGYAVKVTVAPSTAKAITAFSLAGVPGTINESAKTISVNLPTGTAVTALIATFSTTGLEVKVGAAQQVSGVTPNNFTGAVVYTVTATDGSTASYTVTVTVF